MIHGIVYAEQGMYAGWPANHGAWQWGDEFLVGFLRGPFDRSNSMHSIGQPFELSQARSMDGGMTWAVESCGIPLEVLAPATRRALLVPGATIIKVRGVYDHGGDFVDEAGCYFASEDRGRSWHGPYAFAGLEAQFTPPFGCTGRTRTLGDLVLLSRANMNMWGTDEVFCARRKLDGTFEFVGEVANDNARAVMPAVAEVGGRIVAVCRRRKSGRAGGWIEAFGSDDEGKTWRSLSEVGETGRNNGNPPALIERDGTLTCVYGNRTDKAILARTSADRGESWSAPIVLREDGRTDIGYPQLFKHSDDDLVAVYYWADKEHPQQHIAFTRF